MTQSAKVADQASSDTPFWTNCDEEGDGAWAIYVTGWGYSQTEWSVCDLDEDCGIYVDYLNFCNVEPGYECQFGTEVTNDLGGLYVWGGDTFYTGDDPPDVQHEGCFI